MKKFPTAFTILFALIIVVAALTWIIPAGQYERAFNETLGREAPVPGTYAQVEPNPQGLVAVLMAPIAGLYDPATGMANAIDVAVFVLIIGGFLAVVTKTGAIDAGIGWLLTALKGREIWMIPILMAAFAAGGTSYGMAEESLAFYAIVLPVFIRAGYDALTGVAVIMLGCGIGTLGSTFNAFATVIASNAAGVPFTDGLVLRVFILFACLLAGIAYVMRYAKRVKEEPARSVVAAQREDNIQHFLKGSEVGAPLPEFTRVREIILALFGLTFVIMLYGVISLGWWMGEMSALFLGMAIFTFFVAKFDDATKMDEHTFVDTFVNGARDLLGVALIIGVARGIVVIMDAGKITDTILNALAGTLADFGNVLFINVMLAFQTILSFLVPSSSGLAVLTMPILAPLSDFAGVQRDLTVTAYQSANGWVNLFNPTFAVVMGGLAIGRVAYDRWLRFVWPLLVILAVIISAALSVTAMMTDAPPSAPAPAAAPAN
ncbi:MAG TPA: YfcC family protein [Amaricoccus sp.]|uniref:YfcC family protein n=1 Tax=Amaricoccus sp. TaxID=1872485 RepID=UPI002C5261BA|nr:YfcC family protein [Amaricoccus sp.]HMQ92774.1 YfcC family protein [Amaricoccus sp.]HMR52689.1 YfcC family protein [Amaricoccus sp.]HMU00092.1 YfcC family protein [Amaricoccus sp.]